MTLKLDSVNVNRPLSESVVIGVSWVTMVTLQKDVKVSCESIMFFHCLV